MWKEEKKEKIKQELLKIFEKNNHVYIILFHFDKTDLSRRIKLYSVVDNKLIDITYMVATLLDYKWECDETITVKGTEVDPGLGIIYALSYKLYENGYKLTHFWL